MRFINQEMYTNGVYIYNYIDRCRYIYESTHGI